MADGVKVVTNLPDFLRQMKELSFDLENKIFRSGVNAAGNVFKKRAIELAPVRTERKKGRVAGTLKRNVILFRPKQKIPGTERQSVTVRSGRKPRKGAPPASFFYPFYWRWVEAGHRIVPRGSKITGGRRTKALKRARFDASGGGRTQPVWFLRRAGQSATPAATAAFIARVDKRIAQENAKRT